MSIEFMRAESILKSELEYRTNRVRNDVRRNRRISRVRRAVTNSVR
ncbi:hypothetical protein NOCA2240050 [metagenome]|uniref:Uncharacterized protein n=1 Tax=metagenome TaxID=256318 RepID=A0A2P2BZR8_9ZZZZ